MRSLLDSINYHSIHFFSSFVFLCLPPARYRWHACHPKWLVYLYALLYLYSALFHVLRLTLYGHYFLKNLSMYKYGNNQFHSINFMLNIVRIRARVITFRRKYSNWLSDYMVLTDNISKKQIDTYLYSTTEWVPFVSSDILCTRIREDDVTVRRQQVIIDILNYFMFIVVQCTYTIIILLYDICVGKMYSKISNDT